jgi:hypothetical protein
MMWCFGSLKPLGVYGSASGSRALYVAVSKPVDSNCILHVCCTFIMSLSFLLAHNAACVVVQASLNLAHVAAAAGSGGGLGAGGGGGGLLSTAELVALRQDRLAREAEERARTAAVLEAIEGR